MLLARPYQSGLIVRQDGHQNLKFSLLDLSADGWMTSKMVIRTTWYQVEVNRVRLRRDQAAVARLRLIRKTWSYGEYKTNYSKAQRNI